MRVLTRLVYNKNSNFTKISTNGGFSRPAFHFQNFVTHGQGQGHGTLNAAAAAGAEARKKSSSSDSGNPASSKSVKPGTVILHCVPRGRTLPSPSPFVMKLWTYLNMAEIPYKVDTKKPFGEKGKSPWITLDGENVFDSQLCIEYLGKKFNKDLGKVYTQEQLAISKATRIMVEEHGLWAISLWRMNEGIQEAESKVFKLADSVLIRLYFKHILIARMKRQAYHQGMARHAKEDILNFGFSDLRAVSAILGKKKFILGDTPCEDDCGIFGGLSQVMWALPNSPYEKLVKEDLTNLRDYCERMKAAYWPNWDKELARGR